MLNSMNCIFLSVWFFYFLAIPKVCSIEQKSIIKKGVRTHRVARRRPTQGESICFTGLLNQRSEFKVASEAIKFSGEIQERKFL